MSESIYRTAKYIRLSYTDDKNSESDSVANQRKLLDSHIEGCPDLVAVKEYIDDGVSGVIFDRPAFKAMMDDVSGGLIDCIIVKDLSRLGREYIETGRYLRKIFPAYGVRFIALNDNVDTIKESADNLMLSIKNVMNDSYSRDISKKTRTALRVKRNNGDYVGACPIYGYKKAEDNHNQLVIDDCAANIVREIFHLKMEGMSALMIAQTLNDRGVLSPLEYKKENGLPFAQGGYADKDGSVWSATTIIRMLKDETYTGTLIQGRRSTFSRKVKEVIELPESEWSRTENAHEAIISYEEFDLVQKIMRLDTRTAPGEKGVYVFSGVLICGSCGARMSRKTVPYKGQKYHYYYCPTTKKNGCLKAANIKESDLKECILECIKAHIVNVVSLDDIIAGSDGQRVTNAILEQYASQIEDKERELKKLSGFKSALYENMISGLLSKEEYKLLRGKYKTDEAHLLSDVAKLSQQRDDVLVGKSDRLRWAEHFKRFEDMSELTRSMVISLIHSIRIESKTEITITFNYQAEYEKALALVKRGVA